MLNDGHGSRAWSTEGGHVDFAPVDEQQIELLLYLGKRHGHVSYERLLSGDGLIALYHFCGGHEQLDVNAAGVHAAAQQQDQAAMDAMKLFVRIYGAFVGNMALLFKPEAGIYITGGIAAKIISWMKSDDFISAYYNKGRMRALVEQTSVYLVINERVGVLGAISEAVKQAGRE
jgi:glucokinase